MPTFDPITDPDPTTVTSDQISEAAEALEAAEDFWASVVQMATPTVQCPDCGGGGHMAAGSLGTMQCPRCNGTRVIDHPLADEMVTLELPDFQGQRRQLVASRTAWRDRQQALKEGLALPAGADPAVVAGILAAAQQAKADGQAKARTLSVQGPALAAPPARPELLGGAPGPSDDDLDELIEYDTGGQG